MNKHVSLFNTVTNQDGTPMELGPESRPISTLVKVFGLHPLWKDLSSGIKSGFNYSLTPLSNKDWKLDLQESLVFGNHKGVENIEFLFKPHQKRWCTRLLSKPNISGNQNLIKEAIQTKFKQQSKITLNAIQTLITIVLDT